MYRVVKACCAGGRLEVGDTFETHEDLEGLLVGGHVELVDDSAPKAKRKAKDPVDSDPVAPVEVVDAVAEPKTKPENGRVERALIGRVS